MVRCYVTTSWDDCQRYDERLSTLLLHHGIKGTFYIPRNFEGQPVDTSLAKRLDGNFEIGAHTISHASLTGMTPKCAFKEIRNSKEWLEELLNHEIEMFSYPKGKYNNDIVKLVERAGFKGARTLDFQIALPKNQFILGVGPQASNGSPLLRLKAALKSKLSFRSLIDWRTNAKTLFDRILENGGVLHLWGHSWEIDKNNDWKKLEDVLAYVSNEKDVAYLENRQIIKLMCNVNR